MRHILVNGNFLHNEFGIKAGLCSRPCLPTQRMKTGTSSRLMEKGAMILACPKYDVLAETSLVEHF